MYRFLSPDGPKIPGLLGDQAWTALALLDAYEVAGRPQDLERAQQLAAFMIERLAVDGGGFCDTPAGARDARPPRAAAEAGEGEQHRRDGVHPARAPDARRRVRSDRPRDARPIRARRRVAGLLRRRLREGRRPAAEPRRRSEDRRCAGRHRRARPPLRRARAASRRPRRSA